MILAVRRNLPGVVLLLLRMGADADCQDEVGSVFVRVGGGGLWYRGVMWWWGWM